MRRSANRPPPHPSRRQAVTYDYYGRGGEEELVDRHARRVSIIKWIIVGVAAGFAALALLWMTGVFSDDSGARSNPLSLQEVGPTFSERMSYHARRVKRGLGFGGDSSVLYPDAMNGFEAMDPYQNQESVHHRQSYRTHKTGHPDTDGMSHSAYQMINRMFGGRKKGPG